MDFTTYLKFLFILTGSLLLVLLVRTWVRFPSQAKVELDCSEYGSWYTFKNSVLGSSNGVLIQKGKPKPQQKVDHGKEVANHPLDPLTFQEIKKVQKILQQSSIFNHGKFALHSVVLEEPPKEQILLWKAGSSLPSRKATIIAWANGHAYKLIVDLASGQIVDNQISHENGYPAMTMEDMTSAVQVPLKSKKFVEIIGKRGVNVSDLSCLPISLGWFGPDEEGRRLIKIQCYSSAGTANFYMRPIEGLTVLVDMDSKEVLKITDKGKDIPLPKPEGTDYRLSAQKYPLLPPLNPISIEQPKGPSFKVDGHQVKWGSWEFHLKPNPRAGVIISQAAIKDPDTGKLRRVLYKGFTSELFMPYMDPSDAWYFNTYMDAGEYGFGLTAMSLDPLNDCPRNAYYMDGVMASDDGTPYVRPNMVCIFEQYEGDIAWRHTECPISGMEIREVRPKVTLVARMAASVANYDYIVDWEFQTDGLIRIKVGLSGILMIKGTKYENVNQIRSEDEIHGTLLAQNTIGVIHDHYITFYLDMDVDGTDNSFVQVKMAKQMVKNGQTPRKSFWKAERHIAKTKKDAQIKLSLYQPSEFHVINPSKKTKIGNPVGYKVVPGGTAASLLDHNDPPQHRGAFTDNQVDADAEALLNGLNMQSKFFPSLPRNTFERALALYKNAYVKIKSYSSPGANDPHKVIVASKSGKESFCHTKLYDETNADVDVTVVCDNTSTDVTSAIEFTNPLEHAVKNNTQTDQENPYMVLQDDAKMNNSISSSQNSPIFDVKEPMVNVKDADYLVLGCNTNSKGCSEHPLDDVNTRVFSAEPEDGVTDPELVDDHDPRGFSEESNLNTIVSPEELTYGINSMHVSKAPVDPVDAVVLSEEQANIVGPLQVNNVPSLIKRNISILNTEEHKTMSNRHTGNIDFRVTENSSRDFPVPIDSCTDIAVTNKAAAFLEIASSLSLKLVRECEGESHSISMMPNSETVSQVSEFHERRDNVDLDTVNVGCLDPNQQDEDLCGEAGIQQDESPGNTETALENAVESVDSKIGIRIFSPYNLPGSTH